MIRLAMRVTFAGGAEAIIRMAATAVGLALGVTLLLFAAVAFPALHAHDTRAGWRTTSAHNKHPAQDEAATDALLWRLSVDHVQARQIIRVDVAAEGARSPLPPGLARLPGPGQVAASPALQRLLRSVPTDQLGARFAGQITQSVGPAALVSADDLVIFVGHDPAQLRAEANVVQVRSIEAAPAGHSLTDLLNIVLVIGAVGLLVPVVMFVYTATRLAAARREQRLAALRLIGATPEQTAAIAAVEAVLAALAGTGAGFVVFFALRPAAARIPFDGSTFYTADLRLPAPVAAAVAVGVPLLCAVAATASLGRLRVSPLGVARAARPPRPSPLSVVPLVFGLILLAVSLAGAATGHNQALLAVAGLAFGVVILGIMLAGTWLTGVVATGMAGLARRAPALLAARRLQDNPNAAFRNISGLILAAFVASVFSGLTPALSTQAATTAAHPTGGWLVANLAAGSGPLAPDQATALLHTLAATPGVGRVVDLRQPPTGATGHSDAAGSARPPANVGTNAFGNPAVFLPSWSVARCTDLPGANRRVCPTPHSTALVDLNSPIASGQVDQHTLARYSQPTVAPIAAGSLDGLPLQGLLADTDGRAVTVERVRTAIESAAAGTTPLTDTDLTTAKRHLFGQLQRLSNVALLLTLLVAGCSLAIAVVAGLIERKRPFALLRLSGVPTATLTRVVLAEAAVPLLVVAAGSAALGLGVAAMILKVTGGSGWHNPPPGYWYALAAGLPVALLILAATLPLLHRITSLQTARFE